MDVLMPDSRTFSPVLIGINPCKRWMIITECGFRSIVIILRTLPLIHAHEQAQARAQIGFHIWKLLINIRYSRLSRVYHGTRRHTSTPKFWKWSVINLEEYEGTQIWGVCKRGVFLFALGSNNVSCISIRNILAEYSIITRKHGWENRLKL